MWRKVKNSSLICQCQSCVLLIRSRGLIFSFLFLHFPYYSISQLQRSILPSNWLIVIIDLVHRKWGKKTHISLSQHFSKFPLLSVYIGRTKMYVLGLEMALWWAWIAGHPSPLNLINFLIRAMVEQNWKKKKKIGFNFQYARGKTKIKLY